MPHLINTLLHLSKECFIYQRIDSSINKMLHLINTMLHLSIDASSINTIYQNLVSFPFQGQKLYFSGHLRLNG